MKKPLSALITFFAILLLVTPLVNLVMIPEGENGFLISAALLFFIWLVLILMTYLFSKSSLDEVKPPLEIMDKQER